MKPVCIVAQGLVSALGLDAATLWERLLAGQHVLAAPSDWASPAWPGLQGSFTPLAALRAAFGAGAEEVPPVALAGLLALRQAWAQLPPGAQAQAAHTALVLGSTSGGEMDAFLSGQGSAAQAALDTSSRWLAQSLGLAGPRLTLSAACTSSASALIHAAMLIQDGVCELAVAGGCDRVRPADVAGFASLRALASGPCRPFDSARDGIVIGDGAALLILASPAAVARHRLPVLAELVGFGMSCDAFHATASDPQGIARALQQALAMAELPASAIDYVNCHGTATRLNDQNEAQALALVFQDHLPRLVASSTKSQTGHLLGTAGALEAALCVLMLQHGLVPPMATLQTLDPCVGFRAPLGAPLALPMRHAMSNSLGFGGNNVSLIFRRAHAVSTPGVSHAR